MSCLLASLPVVGILFCFTNVVGAALWAIDIEEEGGIEIGGAKKVKASDSSVRLVDAVDTP